MKESLFHITDRSLSDMMQLMPNEKQNEIMTAGMNDKPPKRGTSPVCTFLAFVESNRRLRLDIMTMFGMVVHPISAEMASVRTIKTAMGHLI